MSVHTQRFLPRSESRGMLSPPVCVDVTNDGVKDLLLNAFDGNVTMYNGENMSVIWRARFPGYESYRYGHLHKRANHTPTHARTSQVTLFVWSVPG